VELADATAVLLDAHCTWVVRSEVLESLYIPVALNCWLAPGATVVVPGATAIVCRVGAGTLTDADPLMVPLAPVTIASPAATAVAIPEVPVVTIELALDDQVTCDEQSELVASE
jgi:hypothetical protein